LTKVNASNLASFQSVERSWRLLNKLTPARPVARVQESGGGMKLQLLVSESCVPCTQAEEIWRRVADESALELSVVNLNDPEGRQLADQLKLRTIPAVIIDGVLKAIGVQSLDEARALISRSPHENHP
jgi:glutaredoxin